MIHLIIKGKPKKTKNIKMQQTFNRIILSKEKKGRMLIHKNESVSDNYIHQCTKLVKYYLQNNSINGNKEQT